MADSKLSREQEMRIQAFHFAKETLSSSGKVPSPERVFELADQVHAWLNQDAPAVGPQEGAGGCPEKPDSSVGGGGCPGLYRP